MATGSCSSGPVPGHANRNPAQRDSSDTKQGKNVGFFTLWKPCKNKCSIGDPGAVHRPVWKGRRGNRELQGGMGGEEGCSCSLCACLALSFSALKKKGWSSVKCKRKKKYKPQPAANEFLCKSTSRIKGIPKFPMVWGRRFEKLGPLCASARRFPLKWQKELCFPLSPELKLKLPDLSLGEGRPPESLGRAGIRGGVTSFLFLDSVVISGPFPAFIYY